jgi:hypothetical protein
VKYGANAWAGVKGHLDAVTNNAIDWRGYACTTTIDPTPHWVGPPRSLGTTTYLGTADAAALAACLRLLTPSFAKIAAT